MNIKPLNKSGVTPELLVQHILEDAKDMKCMFVVVAFSKDKAIWEYYTGTASEMALAALVMQNKALKASEN